MKPQPDPGVKAWLTIVDEGDTFISVVTLAELSHGVARLPEGQRKRNLDDWLTNSVLVRYEGRILPVDARIVHQWGLMVAQAAAVGRPVGVMDAFVAATAM